MLPRTERQAEILEYIQSYSVRRGRQPSYAMIARHLGVKSRATIGKHMDAMERRGLIERNGNGSNFTLKLTEQESIRCPKCNHEL